MFKQIDWAEETHFQTLGRNGYSAAHGIYMETYKSEAHDEIHLRPINSKGKIGRARLVIPRTAIIELIKGLAKAAELTDEAAWALMDEARLYPLVTLGVDNIAEDIKAMAEDGEPEPVIDEAKLDQACHEIWDLDFSDWYSEAKQQVIEKYEELMKQPAPVE